MDISYLQKYNNYVKQYDGIEEEKEMKFMSEKSSGDKLELKKWKSGDVFALKISSSKYPDYNGRYLIFIKCDIDKEDWLTRSRTIKYFRIKITSKKELPSSAEEIDNLEYVKVFACDYDLEKFKYPDDVVDLKIDKFNSIYIYLMKLWAFKYVIPEDLIYIGNFEITPPENEYIPYYRTHCVPLRIWDDGKELTDVILKQYEDYNLEKAEINNMNMTMDFAIQSFALNQMRNHDFSNIKDDEVIDNSLTYVGSDKDEK